jgi:hypothetical protein
MADLHPELNTADGVRLPYGWQRGHPRRVYEERFAPRLSKNSPLPVPVPARGIQPRRVPVPETQSIRQHEGTKSNSIRKKI